MASYEVMSAPSATILGRYETEEEDPAMVRGPIAANDLDLAEELAIGWERTDGSFGEPLTGAAPLARLEAAPAPTR